MAKTYSQLKNICIRKTKDNSPDAVSGFEEDLNIAQQIIASLRDWPELYQTPGTLSLVDGTEKYSLASDVDEIEQMRITSPTDYEKELPEESKEAHRAVHPVTSNDSKAVPSYWYFDEPSISSTNVETKQVGFYPIPEQAYTVTYSYKRTIPEMSANGSYPFFNSKYHDILADYAIWQYYEREPDEAGNPLYWQNKWEQGKQRMLETYYSQSKHLKPIPGPDQYEVV